MIWLAATAIAAILAYLGLGTVLYLRQEKTLFHPSKEELCDPASVGIPFEKASFASADGARLSGWLMNPPAGGDGRFVLFCLGNGGNISFYLETALFLRSLGCGALFFNYRSYGSSGGPFPTEKGVCEDAEAAWDFLAKERGVPASRIVLIGRSLGGGVACELALRREVQALVLESTFLSIPAMAAKLYPVYPSSLLARIKFDNAAKAAKIECPCLVVHSFEDELIPHWHGKALFNALGSERKSFLSLTGSHNGCYFESRESYAKALASFLERSRQP